MPNSLNFAGPYTVITNNNTCFPVLGIVSRKTHGSAGDFDIDLPLAGSPGIECRSGGGTNSYTLIYTLDRDVAVAGTATPTQGTATVGTPTLGPLANQVTVNLTGVTDIQHLVIRLDEVQDTVGGVLSNLAAHMDVLVGDVNASGIVTSGDTNLCKAQALQPVTNANFRNDINASGAITTGDVNIIKQNALSHLPP
jgi:hypothetical protein